MLPPVCVVTYIFADLNDKRSRSRYIFDAEKYSNLVPLITLFTGRTLDLAGSWHIHLDARHGHGEEQMKYIAFFCYPYYNEIRKD
jgi:hypothetical protein